jgi:hypothetical protein
VTPAAIAMTTRLTILVLFVLLGCHNTSLLTSPQDDPTVIVDGPLTLTATDFATTMGMLWIAPTAEGGQGVVTARAIQYGSLCATAVTGHADITGSRVDLHVVFTPRLTLCTAEVRALRYDAVVRGLAPGRYDVHILHSNPDGTGESEVRVQSVDVS